MSVFLLASAAHSPGVTSLAVAAVAHSSNPTLLVDANRHPDQSVLAGYLSGADSQGRGLGGLLQAHRERRPLELSLESMLLPLGAQGQFLPGFAHPGMVSLFSPVWPDLATALEAEARTVLVDVGRIATSGPPQALMAASSGLAVVTRCSLPDLAALRIYLPQAIEAAGEDSIGLVLVGPGRPYTESEVSRRFGVPVWGALPWHPEDASVYSHGAAPGRRHLSGAYVDGVRNFNRKLEEFDSKRRVLLGAQR